MMIWFLADPARFAKERKAIDELQETAGWLKGAGWCLEGVELRLDADIEAHGYVYSVKMVYSATFPANPPTVSPREGKERWSSHQYGQGGELCLEWGPDTWYPDVTGAEVLASAFRLLSTENPKGEGIQTFVPSRHQLTLGQELRGSCFRFLATASLSQYLSDLAPGAYGMLSAILLMRGTRTVRVLVKEVTLGERGAWIDASLPTRLSTYGSTCTGIFLSTLIPSSELKAETPQELETVLLNHGLLTDSLAEALADPDTVRLILLQDGERNLHPFFVPSPLIKLPVVCLEDDHASRRVGHMAEPLDVKRVGLVGLGSAGSKIAVTLARSGISRFVLVDDDVFLPENLVRHTLDWRDVGEHKVAGVREQLKLISPRADVEVWSIQLAGQESTAAVAGALRALTGCDLIVDATAEPKVFNQLAMLVPLLKCSLLWFEIYAGGVGGMVARSRTGKDASPHQIRASFNAFTAHSEKPPAAIVAPYTAQTETGEPLVATDADVAVIANHAARMALDALLDREPSIFPYPLYLIGLARGWIFEQPFHTIPIDSGPPIVEERVEAEPEVVAEGLDFIKVLLEKAQHGD
jgi:hypothetical protein